MFARDPRASFTLIELLIVIAVVAVLSVVVVLVLNPAELLKQARDSNRISDMDTLTRAVGLYLSDRGGSLGSSTMTYFSLVDPSATTTAGTNCAGLGMSPPLNWNYHCAASSTVRKTDGTGWIPLNLASASYGPAVGSLPLDSTNTSSSGLYYMYIPGTSTYAVAAALESTKYLPTKAGADGGWDPGRIEAGSNLLLVAQGEGLAGWWGLDEGSGTAAADTSGNVLNGTISVGTSSLQWQASGCKVGKCLSFDGADDYVNVADNAKLQFGSMYTVETWLKATDTTPIWIMAKNGVNNGDGYSMQYNPSVRIQSTNNASTTFSISSPASYNDGAWHHAVGTYDGAVARLYVDGAEVANQSAVLALVTSTQPFVIGTRSNLTAGTYFKGLLDEVKVYSRALGPGEVRAIYNAQR
jgi:large repetitive protein